MRPTCSRIRMPNFGTSVNRWTPTASQQLRLSGLHGAIQPSDPSYRGSAARFARQAVWQGACPAPIAKIYSFPLPPNQIHNPRRLVPSKGRSRSSRTRGGMRWTLTCCGRTARRRTAKSCGSDASTLASSRREVSADDGDNKARSPGRSRGRPLKPLRAGMPGESGEPVVTTLVCFLFLHMRLRVHRAPGIPHALTQSGRKIHALLGHIVSRECEGVCAVERVSRLLKSKSVRAAGLLR
jgi:hypothetical protein